VYDYLVKEGKRVYAVSLEDGRPKVVNVESEEAELGYEFRDEGDFTHVGKVTIVRPALYEVVETGEKKFVGRAFWKPHFLGPYVLVHDLESSSLLAVDVEKGKVETLLDEVGKAMFFDTNTCCGVKELRFAVNAQGRAKLYSFNEDGDLKEVASVPFPLNEARDEVLTACPELNACVLLGYEGTLIRVKGVLPRIILGAKVLPDQRVIALVKDVHRAAIPDTGSYEIIEISNGSNLLSVPTITFPPYAYYTLSDAEPEALLLHETPEAGDDESTFRVYSKGDLFVYKEDARPLLSVSGPTLPDEAVLKGGLLYYLHKGSLVEVEVSS